MLGGGSEYARLPAGDEPETVDSAHTNTIDSTSSATIYGSAVNHGEELNTPLPPRGLARLSSTETALLPPPSPEHVALQRTVAQLQQEVEQLKTGGAQEVEHRDSVSEVAQLQTPRSVRRDVSTPSGFTPGTPFTGYLVPEQPSERPRGASATGQEHDVPAPPAPQIRDMGPDLSAHATELPSEEYENLKNSETESWWLPRSHIYVHPHPVEDGFERRGAGPQDSKEDGVDSRHSQPLWHPFVRTIQGHDGWVHDSLLTDRLSETGRYDRAVSASEDGTLRVWNVDTGQVEHQFGSGGTPMHSNCLKVTGIPRMPSSEGGKGDAHMVQSLLRLSQYRHFITHHDVRKEDLESSEYSAVKELADAANIPITDLQSHADQLVLDYDREKQKVNDEQIKIEDQIMHRRDNIDVLERRLDPSRGDLTEQDHPNTMQKERRERELIEHKRKLEDLNAKKAKKELTKRLEERQMKVEEGRKKIRDQLIERIVEMDRWVLVTLVDSQSSDWVLKGFQDVEYARSKLAAVGDELRNKLTKRISGKQTSNEIVTELTELVNKIEAFGQDETPLRVPGPIEAFAKYQKAWTSGSQEGEEQSDEKAEDHDKSFLKSELFKTLDALKAAEDASRLNVGVSLTVAHERQLSMLATANRLLAAAKKQLVGELVANSLFEKFDADGSASLDFEEFKQAARKAGIHRRRMTDTELKHVFDAVDDLSERDEKITRQELRTFLLGNNLSVTRHRFEGNISETEKDHRYMSGHKDAVLSCCVGRIPYISKERTLESPHSNVIVSASADNTLRVWKEPHAADANTDPAYTYGWYCALVLKGHHGAVTHCCVQEGIPDELPTASAQRNPSAAQYMPAKYMRVFSSSKDGTVRVWQIGMHEQKNTEMEVTPSSQVYKPKSSNGGMEKNKGINSCCVFKLGEQWWRNKQSMVAACSDALEKRGDHTLPVNTIDFGMVEIDANGRPLISWLRPPESAGTSAGDYEIVDKSLQDNGPVRSIGHTDRVNYCCVDEQHATSPLHRKRMLSCADDDNLIYWQLQFTYHRTRHEEKQSEIKLYRQVQLRVLRGHEDSVLRCSFVSNDGNHAVSCSSDNTIRMWDLDTGECIKQLRGHIDSVTSVCFFPNQMHKLLSSSFDTTLRLWDLTCERNLACHGSGKKKLFTSSESVAPTLIGHQEKSVEHDNNCQINGIWALQSTDRVISWSEDHNLRLFSLSSGKCEQLLGKSEKYNIGHSGPVLNCFVYANDTRALSCSEDCTMIVWDIDHTAQHLRNQLKQVLEKKSTTSKDKQKVDVEELFGDFFKEFDKNRDDVLEFEEFKTAARSVDITTRMLSDEHLKRLFDKVFSVRDRATGIEQRRSPNDGISVMNLKQFVEQDTEEVCRPAAVVVLQDPGDDPVQDCCVFQNDTMALSCGKRFLKVWRLDENSCQCSSKLRHKAKCECGSFKCIQMLCAHSDIVRGCCVCPTDTLGLTCSDDNDLVLWSIPDLLKMQRNNMDGVETVFYGNLDEQLHEMTVQGKNGLHQRAMSAGVTEKELHDQETASRSLHGTYRADRKDNLIRLIMKREKSVKVKRLQGHTQSVTRCCIFGDGKKGLSGSQSGELWIWDLLAARCLIKLEGHDSAIYSCRVFDNDSRVLSTSHDHTIRLWNLHSGAEIIAARRAFKGARTATNLKLPGQWLDPRLDHEIGDYAILVGNKSGELSLTDLSNHENTPAAAVLWAGREHVAQRLWNDWVAVAAAESAPYWLYESLTDKKQGQEQERDDAEQLPTQSVQQQGVKDSSTTSSLSFVKRPAEEGALEKFRAIIDAHGTFVQRLAKADALVTGLRAIIDAHGTGRAAALALLDSDKTARSEAESPLIQLARPTIGLIAKSQRSSEVLKRNLKRIGADIPTNALQIALKCEQEDLAELLLTDYRTQFVAEQLAAQPGQHVSLLSVNDIILAFKTYPVLTMTFLQELPLMPVLGVLGPKYNRCDFDCGGYGQLVAASSQAVPRSDWLQAWGNQLLLHKAEPTRGLLREEMKVCFGLAFENGYEDHWSEKIFTEMSSKSVDYNEIQSVDYNTFLRWLREEKAKEEEKAAKAKAKDAKKRGKTVLPDEAPPPDDLPPADDLPPPGDDKDVDIISRVTRKSSVGQIAGLERFSPGFWWDSEIIRVGTGQTNRLDQPKQWSCLLSVLSCCRKLRPELSRETHDLAVVTKRPGTWGTFAQALVVPVVQRKAPEESEDGQRVDSKKPFSDLLRQAVDTAEARDTPAVFNGAVLEAIVQYKWQNGCREQFVWRFKTYVAYCAVLTLSLLLYDEYSTVDGQLLADDMWASGQLMMALVIIMPILWHCKQIGWVLLQNKPLDECTGWAIAVGCSVYAAYVFCVYLACASGQLKIVLVIIIIVIILWHCKQIGWVLSQNKPLDECRRRCTGWSVAVGCSVYAAYGFCVYLACAYLDEEVGRGETFLDAHLPTDSSKMDLNASTSTDVDEIIPLHVYALQCLVWTGWSLSALYTVLLFRTEPSQLMAEGWSRYWHVYNLSDVAGFILTLAALSLMICRSTIGINPELLPWLSMVQAMAGLVRGLGIVPFFRGFESPAFLVYMLEEVIKDMYDFLALLCIVLGSFGFAFHLLLPTVELNGESSEFAAMSTALTTVYEMLFGAFEIGYFRESHFWFIAVPLFILFMLLVPTVMLNALIAIMSDTFARVQQHQVAAGRLEFAKLILELEEQTSSAHDHWRENQMYVPDDGHESESCFLHVLAPRRKSDVGAANRQARSQRIFRQLDGVQESLEHVVDDVSTLDKSVDTLMGESGLNVDAVGGNSHSFSLRSRVDEILSTVKELRQADEDSSDDELPVASLNVERRKVSAADVAAEISEIARNDPEQFKAWNLRTIRTKLSENLRQDMGPFKKHIKRCVKDEVAKLMLVNVASPKSKLELEPEPEPEPE